MPTIVRIDESPTIELPNGRGRMIKLFDPSNVASKVDVHINVLNPGVRKGTIHFHRHIENIYIVLEGQGVIIDKDGKEHTIKAGQAVFFKPGEVLDTHEIYNNGRGPLRLVEIYAPPHPKEVYDSLHLNQSKRDFVAVKTTE